MIWKAPTNISVHMEDLLKTASCCTDKTSHLHSVNDKTHINVRCLESLGEALSNTGTF